LSILHWNCNGLTSKIDELETYLVLNKPDIVSLNEIKCNHHSAIFNLNMLHYNSIFKIRDAKMGGGVALLINKNISFEEINLNEYNTEIVGIKIKTINNKSLHIFSYYNSPSTVLNKDLFIQIQEKYENYLFCGDFNAKSKIFKCNSENSNGSILESIIMDTNAQIINGGNTNPTFHIETINTDYHELLDLFIGSPLLASSFSEYSIINHPLLDSDHSPIQIVFSFGKLKSTIVKKVIRLNYNKADWCQFDQNCNDIELSRKKNIHAKNFKNFNFCLNTKN